MPAEPTQVRYPSGSHVADELLRIVHRLRRHTDAPYREYGWPAAQVRLLTAVDTLGGAPRMGEVQEALGLTGRAVTSTVDALERDGLLTRHSDPFDRRAIVLLVTEAGLQRLARIRQVAERHADATWDVLTPTERLTFLTLLKRVEAGIADT